MPKVLFFVEDPGAANIALALLRPLESSGVSCRLTAAGHAQDVVGRSVSKYDSISDLDDLHRVLMSESPHVYVLGTAASPQAIGLKSVPLCRASSIPILGTVDFPPLYSRKERMDSANNRFRGNSRDVLAYAPDWLYVPDSMSADVFVELGYPSDRIVTCETPHFDNLKEARDILDSADRDEIRTKVIGAELRDRPCVVFATEGQGSAQALRRLIDVMEGLEPKPYLVLRLHPKDTADDYVTFLDRVDRVSETGEIEELLFSADLTVGIKSMLLAESAVLGTPALSLAESQGPLGEIPGFEGIRLACLDDLREDVTACLRDRQRVPAISQDGGADRLSEAVIGILESAASRQ